jgi:hypothetical protein
MDLHLYLASSTTGGLGHNTLKSIYALHSDRKPKALEKVILIIDLRVSINGSTQRFLGEE